MFPLVGLGRVECQGRGRRELKGMSGFTCFGLGRKSGSEVFENKRMGRKREMNGFRSGI